MIYAIAGLLFLGLIGTGVGYFSGRSDGKAIAEREFLAAKTEALADLNRRLTEANREKAEQNTKFLALPDVRNRLCAVQGPTSGCCQPAAKCEP